MTQDEIIEGLEDLLNNLQSHWNNDLWIDATNLVVVAQAIELLKQTRDKA